MGLSKLVCFGKMRHVWNSLFCLFICKSLCGRDYTNHVPSNWKSNNNNTNVYSHSKLAGVYINTCAYAHSIFSSWFSVNIDVDIKAIFVLDQQLQRVRNYDNGGDTKQSTYMKEKWSIYLKKMFINTDIYWSL